MTEIDLVDWTIQEAQQLKSERCQPSDLDGGPVLDRLLAVLEPDPVGATNSEEPVARIASAPSMQGSPRHPHTNDVRRYVREGGSLECVRVRLDPMIPYQDRTEGWRDGWCATGGKSTTPLTCGT